MYNCIYSGHCTQTMCDKSCPTLAETTYLLERNNIAMSNSVFNRLSDVDVYSNILTRSEGKLSTIQSDNTVRAADMLTYCGICQRWRGSRLHCTVYNLKLSQYLESIRQSWSTKSDSEDLEYMKIWASTAKLLIISNIDYVNFRDFECQTLLTLLQSRAGSEFTTIIVAPAKISDLVGSGGFFGTLSNVIKNARLEVKNDGN